ncbi:9042_t:CDS:2 [Rhizophagus irregularis]|nr:9042_t:CDS:2 [Rhizophagus irregularis]
MAAASLPELCLERIFKYLSNDLNSQYSCILINKYWCYSLISKLWENPFESLRTKNKINFNSNLYLINTYLTCLPQDIQNFIGIQEISKPPLFNYPNFLRYISTQNIKNNVVKWAKLKNIKETPKFKIYLYNEENNEVLIEVVESITRILIEYFFTSSTYIKGIDQYIGRYLDIYQLPNAETKLSNLQIFKYIINLIKSQRNLKQILIQYNPIFYTKNEIIDLWNNLMIHKENLIELVLSKINFEILLQQASTSIHSLELFNLDTLTDLEDFTHYFSNITKLTIGINMRWMIVISIVKSANLLREIHIYDGRNNDDLDDLHLNMKPMTADNFLCEIGKVMGEKVFTFRFNLDWYFNPNSLNTFLKRCNFNRSESNRLKILDFRKFKCFSNEHLDKIIDYCGVIFTLYSPSYSEEDFNNEHDIINKVISYDDFSEMIENMFEWNVMDTLEITVEEEEVIEMSGVSVYEECYDIETKFIKERFVNYGVSGACPLSENRQNRRENLSRDDKEDLVKCIKECQKINAQKSKDRKRLRENRINRNQEAHEPFKGNPNTQDVKTWCIN